MDKFISLIVLSLVLICFNSCKEQQNETFNENAYLEEMSVWKKNRMQKLKSEDGWLNLIGLHWLNEGVNVFGSNEDNDIVFPEDSPQEIGAIIMFKGNLSISVNDSIEVFLNDTLIKEHDIRTDKDGNTAYFTMGKYKWHIISRNGNYALRLRDIQNKIINEISDIPAYPVNLEWRIDAEYQPYAVPKEIEIANVIGTNDIELCHGSLNFKIGDNEYELLPLGNGTKENLFLIFADGTSALETYGGGRYLSVEMPDSAGKTIIDFNKSVNPPCAFTEFATCPLPPKENILKLKIKAGEKKLNLIKEHK